MKTVNTYPMEIG